MRDILFRSKRCDDGDWAYGDLCQDKGIDMVGILQKADKPYELAGNKQVDFYFTILQVEPETVGQFTGLIDKNGTKIFEGDILDCQDRIVYVKWNEHCGTWDSEFVRYARELCSNGIDNVDWKYRAAVIGNVHDNSELLTGAQP